MKAKPDLVPDCDVHGEPMVREETPAFALGLEGKREVLVWRCPHRKCGRYFYGTVGYRDRDSVAVTFTPRCHKDSAFLVVQRVSGRYICPVAGCSEAESWGTPDSLGEERAEVQAGVAAR